MQGQVAAQACQLVARFNVASIYAQHVATEHMVHKTPHPGQKRVSSASRGSPTRIRVRGVHGREVRLMGPSSAPTKAVISVARCCVQGLHGAEAFWCGQLDVHLHLRVDLLLLPFVFVHAESISLVGHCVTSKKECKTMFLHKQMKRKEIKVSFRKYRTACGEKKRKETIFRVSILTFPLLEKQNVTQIETFSFHLSLFFQPFSLLSGMIG